MSEYINKSQCIDIDVLLCMFGEIPKSNIRRKNRYNAERNVQRDRKTVWNSIHGDRNRQRPCSFFDTERADIQSNEDNNNGEKHNSEANIFKASGSKTRVGKANFGAMAIMWVR